MSIARLSDHTFTSLLESPQDIRQVPAYVETHREVEIYTFLFPQYPTTTVTLGCTFRSRCHIDQRPHFARCLSVSASLRLGRMLSGRSPKQHPNYLCGLASSDSQAEAFLPLSACITTFPRHKGQCICSERCRTTTQRIQKTWPHRSRIGL